MKIRYFAVALALAAGAAYTQSSQFVEDVPDMPDSDVRLVMNWIKARTTLAKTPFCWRQSQGRGVGEVPGRVADCPPGYTNNGATCGRGADTIGAPSVVASCPAGYTNMGLTCFRGADTYTKQCTLPGIVKHPCREGYTDFGCTCTRPPSSLSASAMVCPAGHHMSEITKRCIVDCPSGYTNTGETCFRPVSTLGMGSMSCGPNEVKFGARCYPQGSTSALNVSCGPGKDVDGGLCYRACPAGFHGIGPVCWQDCPPGGAPCGAGCATSKFQCGATITDEVVSVATVAANIATLGLAAPETAAATSSARAGEQVVMASGKAVTFSTRAGKAFAKAINTLQSIKPAGLAKDATVFQRIYKARLGTNFKVANTTRRVIGVVHSASNDFTDAYADDFATQTSPQISAELDSHFQPDTARYLKKVWASIQLQEMASTNNFNIAQTVLSAVSIVDITGITGLAGSFTKPICGDVVAFPALSQSYR